MALFAEYEGAVIGVGCVGAYTTEPSASAGPSEAAAVSAAWRQLPGHGLGDGEKRGQVSCFPAGAQGVEETPAAPGHAVFEAVAVAGGCGSGSARFRQVAHAHDAGDQWSSDRREVLCGAK